MVPLRRGLRIVATFAALAALGIAACEKRAEPPSGLPPLPGGESAVGAPAPRSPSSPAAPHAPADPHAALPSGHPPLGGGGAVGGAAGLPAGHPPLPAGEPGAGAIEGATPGGELDPKATLRGELLVPPSLQAKVAAGDVIFLVARQDDGTEKGPILAVKRMVAGAWPQPFELDGRDAMQPGTRLAGRVLLLARVDKDGDAISKNPGDLLGTAHVTVPATSIRLAIDRLIEAN